MDPHMSELSVFLTPKLCKLFGWSRQWTVCICTKGLREGWASNAYDIVTSPLCHFALHLQSTNTWPVHTSAACFWLQIRGCPEGQGPRSEPAHLQQATDGYGLMEFDFLHIFPSFFSHFSPSGLFMGLVRISVLPFRSHTCVHNITNNYISHTYIYIPHKQLWNFLI